MILKNKKQMRNKAVIILSCPLFVWIPGKNTILIQLRIAILGKLYYNVFVGNFMEFLSK